MCVGVHTSTHVDVEGQLSGVGSFLLPLHGLQESNSDGQDYKASTFACQAISPGHGVMFSYD